jgi:porphobilinogen synthase
MRQTSLHRQLVASVPRLDVQKFIQPLFVVQGLKAASPVSGLPGVFQDTPESLLHQIERDLKGGVQKFILFVVPEKKRLRGFKKDFGALQIERIKKRFGQNCLLMVDICLCSYTQSGQCAVLEQDSQSHINHQATLEELVDFAVTYAQAGCDGVAPSDMMDDRVRQIRLGLDQAKLFETFIMSYSAKFDSRFYGPFRSAARSSPQTGVLSRSRYQISARTPQEALTCSLADAKAGADILMVKPAMPYLDVLSKLSSLIHKPWAAYEVSGEYASRTILEQHGLMSAQAAHIEAWTAVFRAGAQMCISYGARQVQKISLEVGG